MNRELTYVIGHKNPDTDSICSAIGLAELKRAQGMENIEPARAGDVNPQTAFILDYFNMKPPRYLSNVYPRAHDIMNRDVVTVPEDTPLVKVMEIIRDKNIRFVPVVDEQGRPTGILTLMDVAKRNIEQIEAESSRRVYTSISNITTTLNAQVITDFHSNRGKDFSVYVGAMEEDSFLNVLGTTNTKECIVIVGDREKIQKISVERGIGILIVTGGLKVSNDVIEAAKLNEVSVIISPFDTATTALLVRMSTPASLICKEEFESTSEDELVDDLKQRMTNGRDRGFVVLDKNGVMAGVITKSNLLKPSRTSLILVDHNELSQAVDGADMVKILKVVDHHRLGNFHTTQPITFICEPVGSTSTLISEMYKNKKVPIKKEIAGLLLGGVMSDTIILKSPTTTDRDRVIVPWLEEKSGLDHTSFGREIFSATSSIKKRGIEAVAKGDYKTFETKGKKFGVGQVETIGFDEFYEEKDKLLAELVKIKESKGLRLSALLATDIVLGTSLLLVAADKEVSFSLDYPKLEDNLYELKNVLSRKKQVAPHLLSLFNEIY